MLVLTFLAALAASPPVPPALISSPSEDIVLARATPAQTFSIASVVLGQARQVRVLLPESFSKSAPDRRYPVTLVLDGAWHLRKVAVASDELSRNGLIPESILVAIENVDDFEGRVHDLTPPGLSVSGSSLNEGGDRFLDFLEQELLPAVDRQFRGGQPRILVGTSSGGSWPRMPRPRDRPTA